VRARVAVEAASPIGWHRWVGDAGDVVAMEGFGASAPAKVLYEHFGFTGEKVAERARKVLRGMARPPMASGEARDSGSRA
jgi:transketolase